MFSYHSHLGLSVYYRSYKWDFERIICILWLISAFFYIYFLHDIFIFSFFFLWMNGPGIRFYIKLPVYPYRYLNVQVWIKFVFEICLTIYIHISVGFLFFQSHVMVNLLIVTLACRYYIYIYFLVSSKLEKFWISRTVRHIWVFSLINNLSLSLCLSHFLVITFLEPLTFSQWEFRETVQWWKYIFPLFFTKLTGGKSGKIISNYYAKGINACLF